MPNQSNDRDQKQGSNQNQSPTATGPKEGDRPAKPGDTGDTIVGQTLDQARKFGQQGGQIVKEAVAKGLPQVDRGGQASDSSNETDSDDDRSSNRQSGSNRDR